MTLNSSYLSTMRGADVEVISQDWPPDGGAAHGLSGHETGTIHDTATRSKAITGVLDQVRHCSLPADMGAARMLVA